MDYTKAKEAFAKIESGMSTLRQGAINWYVDQLIAAYDLILNRFSPYKVGDRVTLREPHAAPGNWQHSKHFLVPGEPATVEWIDVTREGKIAFGCVFDNETWVDEHGVKRPTSSKHAYMLFEDEICGFKPKEIAIDDKQRNVL